MIDIKAIVIFFIVVFGINYLLHSDLQRALLMAAITTVLYVVFTAVYNKLRK